MAHRRQSSRAQYLNPLNFFAGADDEYKTSYSEPFPLLSYHPQDEEPILGPIGRCVLTTATVIATIAAIASVAVWIADRPRLPTVRLHSLAVSNLHPHRNGTVWTARVAIGNHANRRHHLRIDRLSSFLFYGQYLLTIASPPSAPAEVGPATSVLREMVFSMSTAEARRRNLRGEAAGLELFPNQRGAFDTYGWIQMMTEMTTSEAGTVRYGLGMAVEGRFVKGYFSPRHVTLKASCNNIEVAFRLDEENRASGRTKVHHRQSCNVKLVR